jgi:hypothetical protein
MGHSDADSTRLAFRLAEIKAVECYKMQADLYSVYSGNGSQGMSASGKLPWYHHFTLTRSSYLLAKNLEDKTEPASEDDVYRRMLILWDMYEPLFRKVYFGSAQNRHEHARDAGLAKHSNQYELHRMPMFPCIKLTCLILIASSAWTILDEVNKINVRPSDVDMDAEELELEITLVNTTITLWAACQVLQTLVECLGTLSRSLSMSRGIETVTVFRGIIEMGQAAAEFAFDIFSYQKLILISIKLSWTVVFGLSVTGFALTFACFMLTAYTSFKYVRMFTAQLPSKARQSLQHGDMTRMHVLDQGMWHGPSGEVVQILMHQHAAKSAEWDAKWPRLQDHTLTAETCMKQLLDRTGYKPKEKEAKNFIERLEKPRNCLVRRCLGKCGVMVQQDPQHHYAMSASTTFVNTYPQKGQADGLTDRIPMENFGSFAPMLPQPNN